MSEPTACPECLRRANLLAQLAPYLERVTVNSQADASALRELLGLPSELLAERVALQSAAAILRTVDAPTDDRLSAEARASECWSVCRHQECYPIALGRDDAPVALFGRGDSLLLSHLRPERTVTIVGARRASTYGRDVARQLGRDLADAGLSVVSGLAFGIDACVHRGALEGGLTVAVLGCGADVAYPAAHRSLWRRISESGLVLSELPPGAAPWRWSFPARNRIMAALSAMTVVVEAAERSGSLVTADFAAELGYDVGAVPGPVGSRLAAAPNDLLASGATLVRDAQDVLDAMLGPGTRRVEASLDPRAPRIAAEALIAEDRVPSDALEDHRDLPPEGGLAMRLTYTAEVRVDRPEQVEELVRLAASAEIGLTVFESESQEPEPECFTFNQRKAIEDLKKSINVVSPYSDADEYQALIDAAIDSDVITSRHCTSHIYIYPMSLSEPGATVAVDVAGRPTLLGTTSTLTEREGESTVDFTLRFLEEVVGEANSLLAE